MDENPSRYAKPAKKLPLEFQNIKGKPLGWNNSMLNVVVQRMSLNGAY